MSFKCELCGSEEKGVRNFYKNQAEGTIGFAIEEYCKGCDTALADIPHVLDDQKTMERVLKNYLSSKQTIRDENDEK